MHVTFIANARDGFVPEEEELNEVGRHDVGRHPASLTVGGRDPTVLHSPPAGRGCRASGPSELHRTAPLYVFRAVTSREVMT